MFVILFCSFLYILFFVFVNILLFFRFCLKIYIYNQFFFLLKRGNYFYIIKSFSFSLFLFNAFHNSMGFLILIFLYIY
ncbi:hypothetical protein U3516DRAFT_913264 [Neocallimastix sp. 'constans']